MTTTTLTIAWFSANLNVTTKSSAGWGSGGGWWSGGWWWGWSLLFPDNCPSWDTSPSYYDRICSGSGTTGTTSGWWVTWTAGWWWVVYTFSDIANSFARDDIINFASKWLLVWYPDGTFRPDSAITRAEFLGVTMKALGIPLDMNVTTTYTDIPASWMIPYVVKARQLGIAYWQTIDWFLKFRPNDPITRAEAVTMALKAAKIPTLATLIQSSFTDIPQETSWAIGNIEKAKSLWIISWQISTTWNPIFRPNDAITRAEAVRVIKNTSTVNQ